MSRRRVRRRGFTLLEIMVALIAGVITITVIYTLSRGSTRVLSEQHRIAQTQTALRMAMEQVRADIERAGLFASPNSDAEPACATAAGRFQALIFDDDQYTAAIPNAAEHFVQADGLVLVGNYVTSGSYMLTGISDNTGSQVAFQPTWQSFRRDFGVPFNDSAYERAFADDRWVHITTLQGQNFYAKVNGRGTAGAGPTIGIVPALSPGGLCTVGLADGATIAPINAIEYAIVDPTADTALAALVGLRTGETRDLRNAIEGQPSVLVRREVDPLTRTVIDGTTRVVLEYAVEFDLEFDVDTTSGPNRAPTIAHIAGDTAESTLGSEAAATPQRLRTVQIRMSARTPDAESSQPWVARADADAPLTRYYARAGTAAQGLPSSRVRTAVATVIVPNVALADLE